MVTVVTVSVDNGLLVLNHDEIPGFMGAMTMGYAVRDRRALAGLSPGDEITADVVVQSNDSWLENIVVVKKAASPPRALAPVRPPEPGDVVPDFSFLNRYGRKDHFHSFAVPPARLLSADVLRIKQTQHANVHRQDTEGAV